MYMLTKRKVKYYYILAQLLKDHKNIKEALECLD